MRYLSDGPRCDALKLSYNPGAVNYYFETSLAFWWFEMFLVVMTHFRIGSAQFQKENTEPSPQ